MYSARKAIGGKKIPGWLNDPHDQMPPWGSSRYKVHYINPRDVLRFELSTKQAFEAMGYSKENVGIMISTSLCTVNDVIAQCEAMGAAGSIFLRIAELTVKLAVLRLGLRFKFSKKQLRKTHAVQREMEILLASLHKQQRLILLETRLPDNTGYNNNIFRLRYYQLPPPFNRWRDTCEKGSEEEFMFILSTGMKQNFSITNVNQNVQC